MSDPIPVGMHNLEDHPLEHYQMHVFEGRVAIVWKTGTATATTYSLSHEAHGFVLTHPTAWLSYFDASLDATKRLQAQNAG